MLTGRARRALLQFPQGAAGVSERTDRFGMTCEVCVFTGGSACTDDGGRPGPNLSRQEHTMGSSGRSQPTAVLAGAAHPLQFHLLC